MAQIIQKIWFYALATASPTAIELVGTLGIQVIAFWLPSLMLLSIDHCTPSFSLRHKIQARSRVRPGQVRHCVKVVAYNQFLMVVAKILEHFVLRLYGPPIALSAQYAHPLEYLFSTILPFWLPAQLLGCHIVTCFVFWSAATVETVIAHSGYDFFTILSKKHDLHHEKNRVNFGTLGFLDWLHGTGA
ncbi:hypothetical protein E4T43_00408 [Aureobasidium subglaciale]|nr:hypothetical protein E4T43_00408 [Aureobasidium subglaciale]